MGIISDKSAEQDVQEVMDVAKDVAKTVNATPKVRDHFDISVVCTEDGALRMCNAAEKIFNRTHWAFPPGPFKRITAFIVLGHLAGLYSIGVFKKEVDQGDDESLYTKMEEGYFRANTHRSFYNRWGPRVLCLAIPRLLAGLRLPHGTDGEEIKLSHVWSFPSPHFQFELTSALERIDKWLRKINGHTGTFLENLNDESADRIRDDIFTLSLAIEATYYFQEEFRRISPETRVRGKCRYYNQESDESYTKFLRYLGEA